MKNTLHLFLQVGIITFFYLIGIGLQKLFHIPIPGSIIGMILLFCLLLSGKIPVRYVERGSTALLSHLQLFFIPVTVGVIDYISIFSGKGLYSVLIVIASTSFVIITTGVITQKLTLCNENEDVP